MGSSISTGNDCIFCLQGIKALQSGSCENTVLNEMIDLFEEIRAAHLLSCDEAPETSSAAATQFRATPEPMYPKQRRAYPMAAFAH